MSDPSGRKRRRRTFKELFLAVLRRVPGVEALTVYNTFGIAIDDLEVREFDHGDGIVCRIEDGVDASVLDDLVAILDKRDLYARRLELGHICIIAYMNDEPACYVWGQVGPYHEEERLGFHIPIDDRTIYFYDGYTVHSWRRYGLSTILLNELAARGRDKLGKSRLMTVIEVTNAASSRLVQMIGFRKTGLWYFLSFAGRKHHRKLG